MSMGSEAGKVRGMAVGDVCELDGDEAIYLS